jgi:hypothetical protein
MNIAILYICTGKYEVFWKQFYESCEKYFLPMHSKHYFVFSDTLPAASLTEKVTLTEQSRLGWPKDTLMRFALFAPLKEKLAGYDYIFFCNANTNFVKTVDDDILQNDGRPAALIVTRHPFFYWVTQPKDYPYERNPDSRAYIPLKKGKWYVMGGFNGGDTASYLELIATLEQQIADDLRRGIVAKWHDESHLNHYLLHTQKNTRVLNYNYGFPEGHDLPLKHDVYLQFLDKKTFGGHDFLREQPNSVPDAAAEKAPSGIFRRLLNKWRS